jgi:DNA-binding NarL/FixJ family response regulator
MARVVIAEEYPLFREALCGLVAELFDRLGWHCDYAEADSMEAVLRVAETGDRLAAILLDLGLLGPRGLSQLVGLRGRLPCVPLVVFSSLFDPAAMHLSMTCGVAGFILKTASRDEVAAALQTVFAGGIATPDFPGLMARPAPFAGFGRRVADEDQDAGALSGRQAAVLDLVADGKSNKQIAWELSISETTVKAHMTAILRKLGVSSRAQAIVLLQRQTSGDGALPGYGRRDQAEIRA